MKDEADNSLDETPRAPTNRREGLKLGAASLMTSLLPIPSVLAAQTESPPQGKAMADNNAIRPFHLEHLLPRPRRTRTLSPLELQRRYDFPGRLWRRKGGHLWGFNQGAPPCKGMAARCPE
jgi:hypothetical protein